jgi:hypothetical protein
MKLLFAFMNKNHQYDASLTNFLFSATDQFFVFVAENKTVSLSFVLST